MTTKKKPSIQTRLKDALAELSALQQLVAKLQKEAENQKQTVNYHNGRAEKAEHELNQVHAFLDAVPNPPAEKAGEYGQKASAMTRLAVFLSTR